jgi:hypothetical protein
LKPERVAKNKKRKDESLLSTEIILTTSNDKDEEYFVPFPNIFSPVIHKPGRNTSVPTDVVLSFKANQEENVLRALADTGVSSSIILGSFLSKDHIINGESCQTNWRTVAGHFTTNKKGSVTFLLPEFNRINKFLGHFMRMTPLSHQTHMT